MGGKKKAQEIAEQRQRDLEVPCAHWWDYAQRTAQALARGEAPPTFAVHGVVLYPNEDALLMTTAWYSRLYAAGNGSYSVPGMFVAGNPAIMMGALAGTMIARSRARSAAEAAAAVVWREGQHSSVIVTTNRLLCNVIGRGWLPFGYDTVTEIYPDLQNWSLTLGFGNEVGPLRLTGPSVAGIIPCVCRGVLGNERWTADPRIAPLLT